jgi:hypothetical protein
MNLHNIKVFTCTRITPYTRSTNCYIERLTNVRFTAYVAQHVSTKFRLTHDYLLRASNYKFSIYHIMHNYVKIMQVYVYCSYYNI